MNIHKVILSRDRSATGTSWKLWRDCFLFVSEAERKTYARAVCEFYSAIIGHNKNTSAAVRNEIIRYFPIGDIVIFIDDDIKKVGHFTAEKHRVIMDPVAWMDTFAAFVTQHARKGYKLFGVAPSANPLNYDPARPYSASVFINGALHAMMITEDMFWDETLVNKGDYDITLQHLVRGYGVARYNGLWQENDYNKLDGGTRAYRTAERNKATYDYLLQKWPLWLKPNPRRELEVILRWGNKC